MSDATFELSARITPEIDERAAQQQADKIIQIFQQRLNAKSALISVNAEKAIIQVNALTKSTQEFNAEISRSQRLLDASQKAASIAFRGTADVISATGRGMAATYRKAADSISTTNSQVKTLSGTTTGLESQSQKLKRALQEVGTSTGALSVLPKAFREIETSVLKGNSELQKAAKSGDGFSKSLIPFLLIGTRVAKDVDSLGFSLRSLDKNLKLITNSVVPFETRFPAAFRKTAEALKAVGTTGPGPMKMVNASQEAFNKIFGRSNLDKVDDFADKVVGKIFNMGNRIKANLGGRAFGEALFPLEEHLLNIKPQPIRDALKKLFKGNVIDITDSSQGILPGFEAEINKLEKRAAPGLSRLEKRVMDAFKGSGKKGISLNHPSLFDPAEFTKFGDTAAKNFIGRMLARFKDERGAISAGFGGSLVSGPFKALGNVAGAALAPFKSLMGSAGSAGAAGGPLSMAATAALAVGAAIIGIGVAALNAAADFERMTVALGGIFGQGTDALQLIADFAAKTPFTMETASNAVIKLASTFEGLRPEGALLVLNEIAGAAAAVGASDDAINRVVIAITQIQARGMVTSDNLRQVTEALPNISQTKIIKELAENLGLTERAAADLLKNGLVPSEEGIKAIIEAAHSVPGATDSLAKQSQTFQGLLSTAKDEFKQLLAVIGQPILQFAVINLKGINRGLEIMIPLVRQAVAPLTALINGLQKLPGIGPMIQRLTGNVSGMGDAFAGTESDIEGALGALDSYQRALTAIEASSLVNLPGNISNFLSEQNKKADAFNQTQTELFKKVLATRGAFEAQTQAAERVAEAQENYNRAIQEHNEQLAKETIDLTKQLAGVRDQLADADLRVIEAQEALNDALAGALPDELERADLSLASAKLRLLQLIEDEKRAQDELNKTQAVAVDLTGLSLDQIRSKLAAVRATLSLQRKGPKDAAKSVGQLEIDALQAGVDRRETALGIRDAEKEIAELRQRGSELDPEVIAARRSLRDAEKDRQGILEQQEETQIELNKLSAVDLDWTREKKGLQKAITEAAQAKRDADRDAKLAVAETKGDMREVLALLWEQIEPSKGLLTILDATAKSEDSRIDIQRRLGIKVDENNTKLGQQNALLDKAFQGVTNPALQSGLIGGGLTFPVAGVAPASTAEALSGAAALLIAAAGRLVLSDRQLEALAKATGTRVPGFRTGGILDAGRESLARLHGVEAVLPLGNTSAAWSVLQQSLPRMSLGLQQRLAPVLQTSAVPSLSLPAGRRAQNPGAQDARKANEDLAKAIARELVAAGVGGPSTELGGVNINVTSTDPELAARKAEQKIKRLLGM